jgi:hypothetical protein
LFWGLGAADENARKNARREQMRRRLDDDGLQ